MTKHPSPLTVVEADTDVTLPHYSWSPEWRPLLARFADAVPTMPDPETVWAEPKSEEALAEIKRIEAESGRLSGGFYIKTWELPIDAIRDPGLRAEMLDFTRALYEFEMPAPDGVILTDMLDELHGDTIFHLFAWLRAAMVSLVGSPAAALNPPTAGSGGPDGAFEPHSDMWVPALLMNVLNDTVPGVGIPTFLPMDDAWDVAASAGMPAEAVQGMRDALVEAGECDLFEQFNGFMYLDKPWAEDVKKAMFTASVHVELGRGQGYFFNDRRWLHGRTALPSDVLSPDRKHHRLYRFVYNNAAIDAQISERRENWAELGRNSQFCKMTPEFDSVF